MSGGNCFSFVSWVSPGMSGTPARAHALSQCEFQFLPLEETWECLWIGVRGGLCNRYLLQILRAEGLTAPIFGYKEADILSSERSPALAIGFMIAAVQFPRFLGTKSRQSVSSNLGSGSEGGVRAATSILCAHKSVVGKGPSKSCSDASLRYGEAVICKSLDVFVVL